jgi:hypothetical protein
MLDDEEGCFMTYDKLTFDLLLKAKARSGYDVHVSVIDLAREYGKEPIFVRQRLVRLHKENSGKLGDRRNVFSFCLKRLVLPIMI